MTDQPISRIVDWDKLQKMSQSSTVAELEEVCRELGFAIMAIETELVRRAEQAAAG